MFDRRVGAFCTHCWESIFPLLLLNPHNLRVNWLYLPHCSSFKIKFADGQRLKKKNSWIMVRAVRIYFQKEFSSEPVFMQHFAHLNLLHIDSWENDLLLHLRWRCSKLLLLHQFLRNHIQWYMIVDYLFLIQLIKLEMVMTQWKFSCVHFQSEADILTLYTQHYCHG